jgi:hypothetical protein
MLIELGQDHVYFKKKNHWFKEKYQVNNSTSSLQTRPLSRRCERRVKGCSSGHVKVPRGCSSILSGDLGMVVPLARTQPMSADFERKKGDFQYVSWHFRVYKGAGQPRVSSE